MEKPKSVLDAEYRFNIADWGNTIHFVSTFRLAEGCIFLEGPVGHGLRDLSRPGSQLYVEPRMLVNVRLITSREILAHDVVVSTNVGAS